MSLTTYQRASKQVMLQLRNWSRVLSHLQEVTSEKCGPIRRHKSFGLVLTLNTFQGFKRISVTCLGKDLCNRKCITVKIKDRSYGSPRPFLQSFIF